MPYLAIVEGDGKKMTSTANKRLRDMGLITRGDGNKEKEVYTRRERDPNLTSQGKGIVLQEGVYYVQDEKGAKTICEILTREGFKTFMTYCEIEAYTRDADAINAVNRINEVLGQRGRPSGILVDYVVTCFNCATSYAVPQSNGKFVVCKNCHSPNIEKTIGGDLPKFHSPNGSVKSMDDLWNYWLDTRFSRGHFIVPEEDDLSGFVPDESKTEIYPDDADTVMLIKNSSEFFGEIEKLPRKAQIRALDAVFAARAKLSDNARFNARIAAITEAIKSRGDATLMSLAEPKNEVDLFDLACVFGPEQTSAAWLTIHHERS